MGSPITSHTRLGTPRGSTAAVSSPRSAATGLRRSCFRRVLVQVPSRPPRAPYAFCRLLTRSERAHPLRRYPRGRTPLPPLQHHQRDALHAQPPRPPPPESAHPSSLPAAFSASSADEYITNPVLAQYTTKLSASLYILFSSTPANMMPAISSLSILIHNRIRLHRLHPQSASNPRSTTKPS